MLTAHATISSVSWPVGWVVILYGVVGLGIVVWLLGRKLARPCCAVGGLVLGGLCAMVAVRVVYPNGVPVVWIAGGAITGCVVAVVMFRVWMAISGAVLLAMATPVVALILQGTCPPKSAQEHLSDLQAPTGVADVTALREDLAHWYDQQKTYLESWWSDRNGTERLMLGGWAGVSALAGLALGLLVPYQAAAFQSALVGAALMVLGSKRLLAIHFCEDVIPWLNQGPRPVLLLIGLITLLGLVLQARIKSGR